MAIEELDDRVVLHLDLFVLFQRKPNARINKERSKQKYRPFETVNDGRSAKNEHGAQHKRPDDSPKKHFELFGFSNSEVRKNDDENEEIVNAQGAFDQVAGEKLHCGIAGLQVSGLNRLRPPQPDSQI